MNTVLSLLLLAIPCSLVYLVYRIFSNSKVVADENHFSQAGVRVDFQTGKINIKGRTYNVGAVQGLEHKRISRFGTEVYIKVDDFKKPIHMVGVMGIGKEGERFVQRLSTALRKAGGPSFY